MEDLKYCLERTDQRPQLLVSLKAALETRLLHPGRAWEGSGSFSAALGGRGSTPPCEDRATLQYGLRGQCLRSRGSRGAVAVGSAGHLAGASVSVSPCCSGSPVPTAGVNTCDIITLYISAIKALRVLDPSMVVLEVACEPIRRYLR